MGVHIALALGLCLLNIHYIMAAIKSEPTIIPAERLNIAPGSVWAWVDETAAVAKKRPQIPMGTGYLEFNPPEFFIQAHQSILTSVDVNQYGPLMGRPDFKKSVAREYSGFFNRTINPDQEISVSTGASEGLLNVLMAFINPGDEVIVMEPFFNLYHYQVGLTKGVLKSVPLRPPNSTHETSSANDWTLDINDLRQAITPKTKVLIVNSPYVPRLPLLLTSLLLLTQEPASSQNPVGKVFNRDELLQIGNICVERDILILADEVYERVVYTPEFPRMGSLSTAIGNITCSVYSVGKAFNATGWRLGFVVGPAALIKFVQYAHIVMNYVTASPVQEAAAKGFEVANESGFWESNRAFLKRKVDSFCEGLREIGLSYVEPEAAFFVWVNTSKINLPLEVETHAELADKSRDYKVAYFLMNDFGIVTIPGSAFYHQDANDDGKNFLRFTVCKTDETIGEVKRRLQGLKPYISNSTAS